MFRTEINPLPSASKISLSDKILTVGSCFSDAIGRKLSESKFNTLTNPFGVSYNPHSIHKVLHYALHNQVVPVHTYLESHELIANYDFHSSFSSPKKDEVEKRIKETIGTSHYFLKDAQWIFITYGSAWVYERNDTGEVVSNCHKMPSSTFTKSLLSQKKVIESFEEFHKDLKSFNPACKIILTVSPVRHLKDTLSLNAVSKSVLRLACQTITEVHPDVFYYPSYEIMIDDLRDYRFYKRDMIHPSDEAEDYIWIKFSSTFFDNPTTSFLKKWKPLYNALQHRPFHSETRAHQSFLKKTLEQLQEFSKEVDVSKEIAFIKSQLKN